MACACAATIPSPVNNVCAPRGGAARPRLAGAALARAPAAERLALPGMPAGVARETLDRFAGALPDLAGKVLDLLQRSQRDVHGITLHSSSSFTASHGSQPARRR